MDKTLKAILSWMSLPFVIVLLALGLPLLAVAQDQDDPPGRVARLGYMKGSVSFQPAGESSWAQAVPNRPMTTGDQLWSDQDSRAEVELGSAAIRLSGNTGFSFLNLDDHTTQVQLTSGSLNISVRRLDRDDVFEVDTPNQAFSVFQPGRYRVEASEDGNYTVVSVREGEGESTGNGQSYTLHAGQRASFSGTESLNADVVGIGSPDAFDNWSYDRDRRHETSRSAQYLSRDIVGYEDLDDYGDWRDDSDYGHVWFPRQVSAGWAPYREGHWDWISPWGWTWVDDASWGYAPYHYGRWVTIGSRWGWVAGPVDVVPVYAPALVVFIGAGGIGIGGNVGWFPLAPREVYIPSYHVSRGYMNRVNISNTTINNIEITNVYNTTIVNRSTSITNVNYRNRTIAGAVTAVPQRAFANAQPVAAVAISVNARELASGPISSRATLAPSRESVLGSRVNGDRRIAEPPPAIANRQVIAKALPPPPPVPFARQQKALAEHPGEPLERSEVQTLRPDNASAAHPRVKMAPPGKPATLDAGQPNRQPAKNEPPDRMNPVPPSAQPESIRPTEPASRNDRQPSGQPSNRPERNQPDPSPRPQAPPPEERMQQPTPPPEKPATPNMDRPGSRPARNEPPDASTQIPPKAQPESIRPTEPAARNDRQPSGQPSNRPERNQPDPSPPPQAPPPEERTQHSTPPAAKTDPVVQKQRPSQTKPLTPEEKKRQDEERKKE